MKKKTLPFNNGQNNKASEMDAFISANVALDVNTSFPKEVYDNAPEFLVEITDEFETEQDKATALFCTIILISAVLPHYSTEYDNRKYDANLYGYIIGEAGSGKGVLGFCRVILEPIHKEKIERSELYRELYAKNKKSEEKLSPPKDEMLIIPGNITKAKIYSVLKENDERGIFIETETDTISSANRSEHGGYSDILRAGNEHEPICTSRKGEGTCYIERPCISMLISSTLNQIYGLIPNSENGLSSRFAFLFIKSDRDFKNVFSNKGYDIKETNRVRGELLQLLYNILHDRTEDVEFRFTEEQKPEFLKFFGEMKGDYFELYDGKMNGVVHRLGVMFTRIAMILSILRLFDREYERLDLPAEIVCNDRDFECTKLIVTTLSENSHKVYGLLTKYKAERQNTTAITTLQERVVQQKRAFELRGQGYNQSEIAKQLNVVKSTISKWFKQADTTNEKK